MLSIAPLPCHLEDVTRSGRDSVQFQPCSAWFGGPLGSSPLPEVGEMILDSVAGSWGSPPPPASFLYYVYLLSVLGYRIGPLQDLADDQPLQTTHSFPGFLCHRWSSPSASSDTSGHICTVAQDTWLLILHLLLLQQKGS